MWVVFNKNKSQLGEFSGYGITGIFLDDKNSCMNRAKCLCIHHSTSYKIHIVVVLKKIKTEEVAYHLFDIFDIFDAPIIL